MSVWPGGGDQFNSFLFQIFKKSQNFKFSTMYLAPVPLLAKWE